MTSWRIVQGDALERLREMPDESVHCVVTSPPYFGLRDYGTGGWEGGDPACGHAGPIPGGTARSGLGKYGNSLSAEAIAAKVERAPQQYKDICRKCGARRVDQLVERSIDDSRRPARRVPEEPEVTRAGEGRNGRDSVTFGHYVASRTVGWEPTCDHEGADFAPAVVLDPFAGAATTGLVALRHGRSFIGIELSPKFVELGRHRIIDDQPLINQAAEEIAA